MSEQKTEIKATNATQVKFVEGLHEEVEKYDLDVQTDTPNQSGEARFYKKSDADAGLLIKYQDTYSDASSPEATRFTNIFEAFDSTVKRLDLKNDYTALTQPVYDALQPIYEDIKIQELTQQLKDFSTERAIPFGESYNPLSPSGSITITDNTTDGTKTVVFDFDGGGLDTTTSRNALDGQWTFELGPQGRITQVTFDPDESFFASYCDNPDDIGAITGAVLMFINSDSTYKPVHYDSWFGSEFKIESTHWAPALEGVILQVDYAGESLETAHYLRHFLQNLQNIQSKSYQWSYAETAKEINDVPGPPRAG